MIKRYWGASLACALGVTTIAAAAKPDSGKPVRRQASTQKRLSDSLIETPISKLDRARQGRVAGTGRDQPRAVKSDSVATYSSIGDSGSLIPPPNDNCVDQVLISGPGPHPFDNTEATRELGSPEHQLCALYDDPLIVNDVWYCWTASKVTEIVKLDTCGQGVDTKIAVYDGCNCLPTDNNLLTCNDDACDLSSDFESSLTFEALAGQTYLVRVGTISFFNTPGGAGSFTINPVELPCDGGSAQFCQQPGQFEARTSNRTTDIVADDFTPAASGNISEVCWWGIYGDEFGDCKGGAADQFTIRYYEDAGGVPGTLLAEFSQTALDPADRLTVTGPVSTPGFLPGYDPFFPEYEYTGAHPSVSVTADTCYWIEISNSVADSCYWYWELGGSDTGRAVWDRDGVDPPVYEAGDIVAVDQAFCLDIQLGDAAQQCPLPSPCEAGVTDCCVDSTASETVGCGDGTCCEAVCGCDPFCCAIEWDEFCAGDGRCGAASLCAGPRGTCPSGEPDWSGSEPMDGVIDARQPRDIVNGSALQGIQHVTVAGPLSADGVCCWDACETQLEGSANFVRATADNQDGTYTLTLDRRITPGALTEVTYSGATSGTGTGTFASLPGDSNADNISDSKDVISIVECCLDGTCPPPYGDYSCDMNHSGQSTSEDLIRLVDLFNGSGALTRLWYGATPNLGNPCN